MACRKKRDGRVAFCIPHYRKIGTNLEGESRTIHKVALCLKSETIEHIGYVNRGPASYRNHTFQEYCEIRAPDLLPEVANF